MTYYGKDVEQYLDAAMHPVPLRGRTEAPDPLREEDRKIISDYLSERVNLKPSTAKVISSYLVGFSREMPMPFGDVDTKMVLKYIGKMNGKLKQNTRRRFYPLLKTFLSWLSDEGINKQIDLKKINGNLKAPGLDLEGRTPSMMLNGEDIKKLIEAAHTSRDRALIAMMYEGSLRPIEVISATWQDINFDKFGAQFTTAKKTGKRPVYPVNHVSSLPFQMEE